MASSNLDVKEILQQLERLPQAARYGVYAGIFVLVVAVYWMTMYGGEQKKLNVKRAQLTKLESEIAEARAIASNLSKFREQRELLEKELEGALQRLPNDTELPGLLTDISGLGKKSGLEIRSFNPGSKVSKGFYAEVPISLEFYGGYHDLAIFFDRLSRLSRIVNVTQLKMSLSDYSGDRPKLSIKGIATTFQFLDTSAGAGAGE